jgi:hypothetical protein
MGSAWKALINREDGSSTYALLHNIRKDMQDMCAQYALEDNPLENPDMKRFKHRAKNKNTKWADSDHLELKQLFDYEFPKDREKLEESDPTLQGYKKIQCKMFIDKLKAMPKDGGHGYHIKGDIDNPADCMNKFLGYQEWFRIPRPVLFWQGDTTKIPAKLPTKGE